MANDNLDKTIETQSLQEILAKMLSELKIFVNFEDAFEFVINLSLSEQNNLFGILTQNITIHDVGHLVLEFIRKRIDEQFWFRLYQLQS